jgi:hypothetical protein
VDCAPWVDLLPDHASEATHEVALVEDQFKVEAAPLFTVPGSALK